MTTIDDPSPASPPVKKVPTTESQDHEEHENRDDLENFLNSELHDTHDLEELTSAKRFRSLPTALEYCSKIVHEDPLFLWARAVKAVELNLGMEVEKPNAFQMWWARMKCTLALDADRDEYEDRFHTLLKKVKAPLGTNPIEAALDKVLCDPLPKCVADLPNDRYKRLAALCYYLHQSAKGEEFFLSVNDACRAIGTKDKETGGTLLEGIIRRGYIERVAKGVVSINPAARRAARYRWVKI